MGFFIGSSFLEAKPAWCEEQGRELGRVKIKPLRETSGIAASRQNADTVWLTPLPDMLSSLEKAGLRVRWQQECSQSHRAVVSSLIHAFAAEASEITAHLGRRAHDELQAAHRLWRDWLQVGRVRKFAFVAEKI